MEQVLLYGVVNFFVAVLSGASGGGGGLVGTPFMVLLGLSPAQAIATAKFGGFGISLGATSRFFKEKITDTRTVVLFSLMGAIGAVAGSLTLSHFSTHTDALQKLMGLTILIIGIPMLYIGKAGHTLRNPPRWLKAIGLVLLAFCVLLQAALGTGIGSLQIVVLISCFGMTTLVASATRRAMQLTVAVISLAIFMYTGLIDYQFGIAGFVSALFGGYIGAHIAIKKGNRFVTNLFAAVSFVLAIQLLLG